MDAFFSDTFELPLPPEHRFPIDKYRCLRQRVTRLAPALDIRLLEAPSARLSQLSLVHTSSYLRKLQAGSLTDVEQRRIGFPWSQQMVKRSFHSTGGTIAAARSALRDGIGVHLAGGTHHAQADAGQGFCVLNDVAVAARLLLKEGRIRRALVVDCDVHQGNGTATIFSRDERVFTFSIHGDRNFPFRKCAGDMDIALPDGAGDVEYLAALRDAIDDRLPLSNVDCVFYLAGADPFIGDRLGRLSLTKAGLAARDRLVLQTCLERRLPTTVVMAGGYAPQIEDIVDIHATTVEIAATRLQARDSWSSLGPPFSVDDFASR